MEKVYLLSVEDLKANGFIHGNVEVENLTAILYRTQDRIIQKMIGTKLYEKLLTLVQAYNNGDTPSTAIPDPYAELLYKKVIPCMIPHVEKRSTTFATWRIRNAGTGTFNDQYFKTSTRQEVKDLNDLIDQDITFYDNELITYLKVKGKTVFPEYECGQECEGGHDPQKKKTPVLVNLFFIK